MSRTCVWPWSASSRAGSSGPFGYPVRAGSVPGATAQRPAERGSVLVISMLILVLLSLVGIAATTTSHFEIQLAGNTKFQKGAFFHTDSAIYTTPKVITAVIETNEDDPIPALPGGAFLDANLEDFRKELVLDNRWDPEPDIAWPFGPVVDVRRMGQVPLPGGGGGGGVGWAISYALVALAGLHVLASLKHHFLDRDRTLLRMLRPETAERFIPKERQP